MASIEKDHDWFVFSRKVISIRHAHFLLCFTQQLPPFSSLCAGCDIVHKRIIYTTGTCFTSTQPNGSLVYRFIQLLDTHHIHIMATPCATGATLRSCSNATAVEATCPDQPQQLTPCQIRQKMAQSGTEELPDWLIPADRQGWRRVVQNFTPSWVSNLHLHNAIANANISSSP